MLTSFLIFVLQLACIAGGATTLYVAMFSYEREDRMLQDALEQWWINLQDVERSLWGHTRRIAIDGAAVSATLIDRWFGPRVWSKRFLSISTVLSFGPASLIISVFFPFPWLLLSIPIAVILIWRAFLPIRTNKPPYLTAGLLVALCLSVFLLPLVPGYEHDWSHVLIVALLFAILANAYAVKTVRSLLRFFGERSAAISILVLPLLVCIGIAFIAILSIFFLGPFSWILVPVMSLPAVILSFLPVLLLFVFTLLVVSAHLLGRGVYAAQRHGIVYNKRTLWALAVAQFSVVPLWHFGLS